MGGKGSGNKDVAKYGKNTQFKPGQGRAPGIVYPGDYIRTWGNKSIKDLEAIIADPDSCIAKLSAARLLLDSFKSDDDKTRLGTMREVLDRTSGKAAQHIDVEVSRKPDPQQLIEEAKQAAQIGNTNTTNEELDIIDVEVVEVKQ